jgi:hypothetical protein
MKLTRQIDVGDTVICDWCGADWTGRPESGGILFQSKALCPNCAKQAEPNIRKWGETHYIRGRCPEYMSFADWVLMLRGGDNTIKFYETD